MNKLSPKPLIVNVVRSWQVPPGMVFAVAEDLERRIWIMESTPVGTQCWTVQQAAEMQMGVRTRRALREAVALGRQLEGERALTASIADALRLPQMLLSFPGDDLDSEMLGSDLAESPSARLQHRQANEPVGV